MPYGSHALVMALLATSILLGFAPLTFEYTYAERFPSIDVTISYRGYTWPLQASASEPEFLLLVKNSSGKPLKAIYSVYAWMPNGEIKSLGIYGGAGVVRANYSALRDFSREWIEYLASRNTDPRYVSPGIILMGAIHEDEGVYDSIKGVPIKLDEIAKNRSITIEIIEHLEAKKPIAKHNKSQENMGIPIRDKTGDIKTQDQWPPGNIYDACYWFPGYSMCYYWVLEKNYGSMMGVPLPIVAAIVYGPHVDKVQVHLAAYYKSTSTDSLNFGITASVGSSASIDYQIIGYTTSLREDKTWLDIDNISRPGVDFTPPAILGIGFLGDIAAAKYRLYIMTSRSDPWNGIDVFTITQTDTLANMTLMRPVIVDSQMFGYIMKDENPYDGQGVLENALRYYRNNWAWSKTITSQNYVYIDEFKVINDLNTLPILSGSVDVLGILCGVWNIGCDIAISSILGASVGVEQASQTYMYLHVIVTFDNQYANKGYWISANYFYSPSTLLYGGNRYYIGSLYTDILVY